MPEVPDLWLKRKPEISVAHCRLLTVELYRSDRPTAASVSIRRLKVKFAPNLNIYGRRGAFFASVLSMLFVPVPPCQHYQRCDRLIQSSFLAFDFLAIVPSGRVASKALVFLRSLFFPHLRQLNWICTHFTM
jgi:hypothetical protein